MTSRELLVYAKHMDTRGAFKRAARRGNFSTEELVTATIANQLLALRRDYYIQHGGESYDFEPFISEAQRSGEDDAYEGDEDDEDLIDIIAELRGATPNPEEDECLEG